MQVRYFTAADVVKLTLNVQENKFPTSEFISFLNSISSHSPLLAALFKDPNAMTAPAAAASAPLTSASSSLKEEAPGSVGCERKERDTSPTVPCTGVGDERLGAGGVDEEELEMSPDVADGIETEADRAQHFRRLEEAQVRCAARKESRFLENSLLLSPYLPHILPASIFIFFARPLSPPRAAHAH